MFNQLRGTAAPLDAGELAAAIAPFGESRVLPPTAYTSDAVFAWEQANILTGWICVGHAADLGEPASQRAVDTGNGGVLLTRDEQGVARAFANTCRHRGHELLPCGGSRKARSIVCPYHSWSYKLDGTLRAAPGFRDVPGFEPGEFGLAPVPVAEWHGYLFVDPSGTAGDFAEHLRGLDEVVGRYRPEDLVVMARHTYELATNWKIIVENYQECYHCATIHPELSRVSPPDSGATLEPRGAWLAGWMDLVPQATTMSLDGRSDGRPIAGLSETELRTVMYVVAYPNLLISLHPDYVMTHVMRPLAADRTHVECAWAFPREVAEQDGFDPSYAVDFWDLTNRQDWAACESVQRGLRSSHARPGPLAPDEDGVHQFVTRVARAYQGNGRSPA
jgi:Rieske 2Fe-2S family protein